MDSFVLAMVGFAGQIYIDCGDVCWDLPYQPGKLLLEGPGATGTVSLEITLSMRPRATMEKHMEASLGPWFPSRECVATAQAAPTSRRMVAGAVRASA